MTRPALRARVAAALVPPLAAGVLLAAGVSAPAGAAAAPTVLPAAKPKYVACTYVVGQSATDCAKTTFTTVYTFTYNVCWRLRPSSRTFLERRQGTRWVRIDKDVTVSQGSPCRGTYPWKTATRLAVKAGPPRTTEYRFVLPKTWQYARATYAFGVCVLPAGSRGPCPAIPTPSPSPSPTTSPSGSPTPTDSPSPTPSPSESALPGS